MLRNCTLAGNGGLSPGAGQRSDGSDIVAVSVVEAVAQHCDDSLDPTTEDTYVIVEGCTFTGNSSIIQVSTTGHHQAHIYLDVPSRYPACALELPPDDCEALAPICSQTPAATPKDVKDKTDFPWVDPQWIIEAQQVLTSAKQTICFSSVYFSCTSIVAALVLPEFCRICWSEISRASI